MKYTDELILEIYENLDLIHSGLTNTLHPDQVKLKDCTTIYYIGGHGVMWNFPDDLAIQNLSTTIYDNNGYLVSVCHGVVGRLNIKDRNGNYLIEGKNITGFTTAEEIIAGKNLLFHFFNQEADEKRGGHFKKKRFYREHALKDGQILTGQNPFSVRVIAKLLVDELI